MLGFLAFGPWLVMILSGPSGKPVHPSGMLPAPDPGLISAVDSLEPVPSFPRRERLMGWAFMGIQSDQTLFSRFLVLQNETQTYFFPVEAYPRPDVQAAFDDTGTSLLDSGFSALIYPDVIAPGSYQVGMAFQQRQTGRLAFNLSKATLERTPNTLKLIKEETPAPVEQPDSPLLEHLPTLPLQGESIVSYLDGLAAEPASHPTQYVIFGWAFLPAEADQSSFERIIILKSAQRTYALQATTLPRPDVQAAFPDIRSDISASGFEVRFAADTLPASEYSIGILFRDAAGEAVAYQLFNHRLIQGDKAWQLETVP